MSGRKIFISYRRQDTAGHAGRLYDHMAERFGPDRVFRDIDGIPLGENFVDVLRGTVSTAGVVLVVIGRDWLTLAGTTGRRLDEPNDFVRLEIQMALEGGITTIPILVEDAPMPAANQLPPAIEKLAYANALKLSEDTFSYECTELSDRIEKLIGGKRRAPWQWVAAAAVLATAGVAAWSLKPAAATVTQPSPAIQASRELVGMKDYAGAWKLIQTANDPAAREDIAMAWLRDTQVPEGHTFAEVVDQLSPVLAAGVTTSKGARQADLLAHLGWGTYLRSRDGGGADPRPFYERALVADPKNPFANAMMGHYLLGRPFEHAPLEKIMPYFATALASNRERPFVRTWELAALGNASDPQSDGEYLRVLNDMRKAKEPVPEGALRRAANHYYSGFRAGPEREALLSALSPAEHVAVLEWVTADNRTDTTDGWLAQMQEAAGNPQAALAIYERLAASMGRDASGELPDAVRAGIKRLKH